MFLYYGLTYYALFFLFLFFCNGPTLFLFISITKLFSRIISFTHFSCPCAFYIKLKRQINIYIYRAISWGQKGKNHPNWNPQYLLFLLREQLIKTILKRRQHNNLKTKHNDTKPNLKSNHIRHCRWSLACSRCSTTHCP